MSTLDEGPNWIFINKTPGKLARTPHEKVTVATHIGKTTRKQSHSKRLTLSISTPPFHIAKYAIEKYNQFLEIKANTPSGDARSRVISPFTSSRSHDFCEEFPGPLHCCSTHPEFPNLAPVCFKGNSDPFSSTSVGLSSFLWDVVQASLRFLVFSSNPSNPARAYRTQLGDFTSSRMPIRDNITSSGGIHAILAAGYLVKASTSTSQSEELALIEQSERYKLKCISRIRRDICTNHDLGGIIALLRLLISLEFFTGNYKAATTHLRGLRAVCAINTDWWMTTEDFIILADTGISLSTLSKTEMNPSGYDPGPRHSQTWNESLRISHKMEDSKYSALATLGKEIGELSFGVEEVVDTVRLLTNIISVEDPISASATHWLSRRASALASRLLASYVQDHDIVQSLVMIDIETEERSPETWRHALKAATTIILILSLSPFSMEYISEGNFSRVSRAIEPMLRICWETAPEEITNCEVNEGLSEDLQAVYWWAVCCCALYDDVFCSRGHTKYSGWARGEFQRLCSQSHAVDTESVRRRLQRCTWYGGAMDEFLSKMMYDDGSSDTVRMPGKKQQPLLSRDEWTAILWRHFVEKP